MGCMGCQKARAQAVKNSPTRSTYTPKKMASGASRAVSGGSYGSPRVRLSFGSKKGGS